MPTYTGTEGDDSIGAWYGSDWIYGYGGNDTIWGYDGNDHIYGGIGNDFLVDNELSAPDTWSDDLQGGEGNDMLFGGYSDIFAGGPGYDVLYVDLRHATTGYLIDFTNIWSGLNYTIGDTYFSGMDGVNGIYGTYYDDIIYVRSPESKSTFTSGGAGADFLIGGSGFDFLGAYTDREASNEMDYDVLLGDAGNDTITLGMGDYGDGGIGFDRLSFYATSAETGVTIDFATLLTTGSANILGAELYNFESVAAVWGGAFDDVINVSAQSIWTKAYGEGGDDRITTGSGEDLIDGGAGNDTIFGGAGNDIITGGAGSDSMNGGDGDDSYTVDDGGDKVYEYAAGGNDSVLAWVSYSLAGQYIETLELGGSYHINGTGNNLANTLKGSGGNNVLNGGGGADLMIGGYGNDRYIVDEAGDIVSESAYAGTDRVDSAVSYILGTGLETLFLTGNATITGTGNAADNFISGNSAGNLIDGGTGADTMEGNGGNDRYIVDNVGDTVSEVANEGTDTVDASISYSLAGQYIETLRLTGTAAINGTGNNQANDLIGNAAANRLEGAGGDDGIQGAAGNDVLEGGLGRDTLVGGADADWFVFDDGETGATQATADVITDFSHAAGDKIDLSGVDAIAGSGDNAFTYIGASTFTGVAGELRYEVANNFTTVYGDVNGDAVADLAITMNGTVALSLGDFIL